MSDTQQVKQKPIITVQPNYTPPKNGGKSNVTNSKDIQVFVDQNNKPPVQATDKNPAQKTATKPIIKPVDKKPQLEKSISWREGFSLLGQGFVNKAKDLWKTVTEHPVQSLAAVGVATGAIFAAPLVGITSAVAASALAVGFAGVAAYNGIKHGVQALKHSNDGKNNKLREDLKNLGGDGLDLALTIPFVPKGVGTLAKAFKYAPKIGLNMELLSGLRQAKSICGVLKEVTKANFKINYLQIAEEMGFKAKPKLVISDKLSAYGHCDEQKGIITINDNIFKPLFRMKKFREAETRETKRMFLYPEITARHELEHFKQGIDIARNPELGIPALKNMWHSNLNRFRKLYNLEEFSMQDVEAYFNKELYDKIIADQGLLPAGSVERELTKDYLEGFHNGRFLYRKNPIEIGAFNIEGEYFNKVIKGRPGKLLVSAQALNQTSSSN